MNAMQRNALLSFVAALVLAGCSPQDEPVGVEPAEPTSREAPEEVEGSSSDTEMVSGDDLTPGRELDVSEEHVFAEAEMQPVDGSGVTGTVHLKQRADLLEISGRISGLAPGEHGFHVHENGNCDGAGALSAGGHFSPENDPHGSPQNHDVAHHAGDLGNILADEDGNAEFSIFDTDLNLGDDASSIINRAIIVHENADDFVTQPAGNAGKRVGCAVVKPVLRPAYVLE